MNLDLDISKCDGGNCVKAYKCWRFLAPADKYRQSWIYAKDCLDANWSAYWEVGK